MPTKEPSPIRVLLRTGKCGFEHLQKDLSLLMTKYQDLVDPNAPVSMFGLHLTPVQESTLYETPRPVTN
jgi:hypothetical protein